VNAAVPDDRATRLFVDPAAFFCANPVLAAFRGQDLHLMRRAITRYLGPGRAAQLREQAAVG